MTAYKTGQSGSTAAIPADLLTDEFDFDLPSECIATEPARPRESARMLEVGDCLTDRIVADLPGLLAPGDVLVINDTRVIPARLRGTRRGDILRGTSCAHPCLILDARDPRRPRHTALAP